MLSLVLDKFSLFDCINRLFRLIKPMEKFYDIYHKIPSSRKRREALNRQMSEFDLNNLSCKDCIGNCCTFTSNSMMITPIEALDVLDFLKKDPSFHLEALVQKLESTIEEFRLNQGNTGIRKTYTCPFYTGAKKGCTISKHSKPFGCLAFLPSEAGVTEGKTCFSKLNSLKKREEQFKDQEDLVNKQVKIDLNITWKKLSIPEAVLDLIKKGEHLLSLN